MTDGKLTKIVERVEEGQKPLLKGPETVILDNKGALYAFSRGAKLIKLDDLQQQQPQETHTMTARTAVAADLGRGAPLSGKFTKDGKTLYVVDPLMGLFRIRNFHEYPTKSRIELVANKVMDNGVLTRILYADDVAIGPKTGKVYFTDGTLTQYFRHCTMCNFSHYLLLPTKMHHVPKIKQTNHATINALCNYMYSKRDLTRPTYPRK